MQTDFATRPKSAGSRPKRSINPLDKEAWLRLAGDWIKLAQAAEERRDNNFWPGRNE
jgi:hypothetical protein